MAAGQCAGSAPVLNCGGDVDCSRHHTTPASDVLISTEAIGRSRGPDLAFWADEQGGGGTAQGASPAAASAAVYDAERERREWGCCLLMLRCFLMFLTRVLDSGDRADMGLLFWDRTVRTLTYL